MTDTTRPTPTPTADFALSADADLFSDDFEDFDGPVTIVPGTEKGVTYVGGDFDLFD